MARFASVPSSVKGRYAGAVLSAYGFREAQRMMSALAESIASGNIAGENLAKIGANAVELAKARTPVDTGRLLASNKFQQLTKSSVVVYNSAPYALYVEDGTSRMEARPFLRPAVMIAKSEFPQLFIKDYVKFYSDLLKQHAST